MLYRGVTKRKTNIYRKRQIYIEIYIVHSFRQWWTLGGGGGHNLKKNWGVLFHQVKTFSNKNDYINTLFFLTQRNTTTLH